MAANLADRFGLQTGMVTTMVDYPICELITKGDKAIGITLFY